MRKFNILFIIFCIWLFLSTTILFADSGVLILLNNGKKYIIPSEELDHIEFFYEQDENKDQNNSSGSHVNTNVTFNYKYHIQTPDNTMDDWFDTQVGTVCLYVFNDKDEFLFQKSVINTVGDTGNNSIAFTEDELKPGQTYKLGAFCLGDKLGYDHSILSPGYRLLNDLVPLSSKLEDLILKLVSDKNESGYNIVDYKAYFSENDSKLDTLWTTRSGNIISVTIPQVHSSTASTEDILLNIDIPLMKITNSIKINLVSDNFNTGTHVDDYEFVIDFPKGNDLIGLYGDLNPSQSILYRPLRKAVRSYNSKTYSSLYDSEKENGGFHNSGGNINAEAPQMSISADFGLSRLMADDKSYLKIINKTSGQVIFILDNLSDWLADYFNSPYSNQEFLDREYDFSIDIQIDEQDNWIMLQAGCSGLGWGKRLYNYVLQ